MPTRDGAFAPPCRSQRRSGTGSTPPADRPRGHSCTPGKSAIRANETEYAEGLPAALVAGLGSRGIQTAKRTAGTGTRDFATLAAAVRDAGADAVAYAGYAPEAARFAKA